MISRMALYAVMAVAMVIGPGGLVRQAPAASAPTATEPSQGQGAGFQPGQALEVREGDTWSPATLVKREGRRYQIRYDDNTEEWVTVDRLRARGAAAPAAALGGAAPATPALAAPREPTWNIGQKVGVKWGGLWFDASVKNKGNGWYLVEYQRTGGFEWVEPWRIRPAGSNEDTIPHVTPGKRLRKPEPPPTIKPGPRPAADRGNGGVPSEDPVASEHAPVKEVDRSGMHEVVLGTAASSWSLTPDSAPEMSGLSPQPAVLRGAADSVFEEMTPPLFAPSAGQALLVHFQTAHGRRAAVERVDLKGARSLGVMELPVVIVATDISSDGVLLLGRTPGIHFGEAARLDIWKIDSPSPEHLISFLPYGEQAPPHRNITWARYIGPERVATMNGDGRLIVWDFRHARAVWAADISSVTPAISAGGKHLALVADSRLVVVDPADGRTLASLQLAARTAFGRLSFRPDGKQLAFASDGMLRVFDVGTGKQISETPFDGSAETIDWPADGFILLDGSILLDLARQMPLWQYRGAAVTGTFGGRTWYVASLDPGGKKPVLASGELPGEAVKKAATGAKSADIWAAMPGMSVTLDTSGLPGDIQGAVADALKEKLIAHGFHIADNQPIRLVASVETGEAKEIRYRGFGESPFGAGTTVHASPQTSRLAFIDADGAILWQRQATRHPPMTVSLKEGQSIEQYIADATRPDANFYKGIALVKFIPKAQYKNGLGASELTARGVIDAPPPRQAKR